MKVKINDLKVGAVISEDVMGMTNTPIIPKDTVLEKEHIDVLKSFLKTEVSIEGITISKHEKKKKVMESKEAKTIVLEKNEAQMSFLNLFEDAVKKYKLDFKKWQSGSVIDIANLRDYLYSLLEKAEEERVIPSCLYLHSNQQDYIYYHSISVGIISGLIAKKMSYEKGQYYQTALAGCLANAGMAKVSHNIISKPTNLSKDERNEMENHPNSSLKMVQNSPLLKPETKLAIFQHHERIDGSGYPMGVKGQQLYPISRIIAVADVFHALVSDRLYKAKVAPLKAIEILRFDGFGKYDISVINTLISMIANLTIGSKVKISNSETGEVIFTKQSSPTRPLVKLNNGEVIDLEKTRDLYIEEVY